MAHGIQLRVQGSHPLLCGFTCIALCPLAPRRSGGCGVRIDDRRTLCLDSQERRLDFRPHLTELGLILLAKVLQMH